jgi:hypothetical protein
MTVFVTVENVLKTSLLFCLHVRNCDLICVSISVLTKIDGMLDGKRPQ